jgi:cytoskeleton protein RodZ
MNGGHSMSETSTQEGSGLTAGALLRRAREEAGLHVEALAVSLKVPVRKLEALEEDRYERLTDTVFVRALASSVCRTLKIDPRPVLERLPQTIVPRLVSDSDGINTAFRPPSDGAPPSWRQQLSKPVFLVVFALLLGALVLVLLPSVRRDDSAAPGATSKAAAPAAAPAAAEGTKPPPAEAVTTVLSPALAQAAAGGSAAPVAATAGAATPASAAAVPAADIVVFRANGPSWVEVTDAKGVVAVRKLLAAGEATGASGVLPLQVTIGRADFTQVHVRGKAFDLGPVSRDNVARFEVQ